MLVDESAGKAGDLYIRSVCFSPDGKYLATGAEDKKIRVRFVLLFIHLFLILILPLQVWDIAKKRICHVFEGHQQDIYALDFSPDGRFIVSGSGDKTARIWDMVDGSSKVLTINDPDSSNHDAGVTSVTFSPNGQLVAAGSLDTQVRIWDVATAQLVKRFSGHKDSVYSVAFTPDGKGLLSGSLDKTLKYWDVSGLTDGSTMDFRGHKVRFYFSLGLGLVLIACRIMYCLSRYLVMDNGSFLDRKTVGCSFGIRGPELCSVCCRGIKIRVS